MTADNDASAGALVLTPPQPVANVTPAQATSTVKLDPATEAQIDATVQTFAQSLATLDIHSPDFQKKVDSVSALGDEDIRQSAQVSNRLLDKPAAAMSSGVFDPTSKVANSLVQLRRTVQDLDPAKQGLLSGAEHRLLGVIPFGNKLRDYFHKYESSQNNINAIIQALYSGQDELRKDNASIEQEKVNLWAIMQRLQQYDYMAKKLDAAVSQQVTAAQATDPARAKQLQDDVLFYVRQKDQDILTQLAVSVQGYLALDVIRRNNVELIKGVDRATTTTVSALRTAVIVAQALSNQKLVLDQITALNTTTGNLIESTSELLKQQSGQISEQAATSTVNLQQLQ
ncbi:MAG TPA: toxic anion resistance protein, partial [Candidatus Dormibacteraeota bacterium]|nr:toxic anion resistance protein [Candidatus Dormibacteraeota bacterium]